MKPSLRLQIVSNISKEVGWKYLLEKYWQYLEIVVGLTIVF